MSTPSNLSKEQEAEIQKLNQMSQQFRAMQSQQMQLEGQKVEMQRTLESLKGLSDGHEMYRQTGTIMFKADLMETRKEFEEKLELLEIRVKQGTKKLAEFQQATQDLETKIRGYLQL